MKWFLYMMCWIGMHNELKFIDASGPSTLWWCRHCGTTVMHRGH